MRVSVLQVPYDSGHFGRRMGRGPLHLAERGLLDGLAQEGHEAELVPVRLPEGFFAEVGAAAEIHRRVAEAAAAARAQGRFPLVLTGNCNTALGIVAGLGPEPTAVVWLDAHGDFNTPDTSLSGFFDGMAVSALTGGAWRGVTGTLPGFHPVAERNVVLIGVRDLDPEERRRLEASEAVWVHPDVLREKGVEGALGGPLDEISWREPRAYLHVDLDVLDPEEAKINVFSVPGGLTVDEVIQTAGAVGRRFEIAAATLSAYDPDHDSEDRGLRAAERIAKAILAAARLVTAL
ncbi:MAG TPA: arginase family protein [Thermoanaerobaculia bacterium]